MHDSLDGKTRKNHDDVADFITAQLLQRNNLNMIASKLFSKFLELGLVMKNRQFIENPI